MKLSPEIAAMACEIVLVCTCQNHTDAYLLRDDTVMPWEDGWEFISGQWYCPSCVKKMAIEKSLADHADVWKELANL